MNRVIGLVAAVLFMSVSVSNSSAGPIRYFAFLDGPSESPPVASPGTGFATFVFDPVANTLALKVSFRDLIGTTTVAHIHGPTTIPGEGTASVATMLPTFAGFPVGLNAGSYSATFDTDDLATYNPAFVAANGGTAAGAEAALGSMLASGRAYLNIHSTFVPSGEIRGFIQPVPEPSSLIIWGIGLLGMFGFAKVKARRQACSAI